MNWPVIVAIAALIAFTALRWFVRTSPARVLSSGRVTLLWLGIGLVGILVATGRIGLAVPLAMVLTYLYGSVFVRPKVRAGRTSGTRKSMVRSAALEMELDHHTGRMTGRVLAGSFEGRDLDTLDAEGLGRLAREISGDPESRALLEAYLDRRMPGWRENAQAQGASRHRGTPHPGAMSEEEAYQILGLQKGAGEPEIRAAHRRLMKKVHPDQGGSTFLAARINEAKDRLLSKHR